MSLVLILGLSLAWLLTGVLCIALCVSAARGDREQARAAMGPDAPSAPLPAGLESAA